MVRTLTISLLLACTACSPQQGSATYTGRLKIDAGTEYAALEVPSSIGGACDGWNTVEIRKLISPEQGSAISSAGKEKVTTSR